MSNEIGLWERIKARRLQTNVYVLLLLMLGTVASAIFYLYATPDDQLLQELLLAICTSFMASVLVSAFDIYTSYENFEHSEFIDNLYHFGIHNLHFDKEDLLSGLIKGSKEEIWVSGYRLILTQSLAKDLYEARKRGVNIKFLLCPPWDDAFSLVYDDPESSLDNYIHIMRALGKLNGRPGAGTIEVHFTAKPLFNDTYRVDDKIVTSPYMHNEDITFGVMTAGDFFTYEVDKDYRLWQLLADEYTLLWNDCKYELTQEGVTKILEEFSKKDLDRTYSEKVKVFRTYWQPIGKDGTGAPVSDAVLAASETEEA